MSLAYTGGLGGQVCRRTPKSQAVYPFTRFDQVNALAGASEDIAIVDQVLHRGDSMSTDKQQKRGELHSVFGLAVIMAAVGTTAFAQSNPCQVGNEISPSQSCTVSGEGYYTGKANKLLMVIPGGQYLLEEVGPTLASKLVYHPEDPRTNPDATLSGIATFSVRADGCPEEIPFFEGSGGTFKLGKVDLKSESIKAGESICVHESLRMGNFKVTEIPETSSWRIDSIP